ncbi:MAG: hypothetical protein IJD94_01975 [Clostridia bacterium]|nr:hypothetical protein [Clostridia bacterium]
MHEERIFLRALLRALIAEREDADALYIPRGEAGMRRMIRALLDMRPPEPPGTPMHEMIRRFTDGSPDA